MDTVIQKRGSLFPSLSQSTQSAILFYAAIAFFIALGDALMSYISPIYIESLLNSSAAMGLVFATSSVVGLAADIVLGAWFRKKKYSFFMFWTSVLAICFPLSFIALPPLVPFLIASMAIWGIYYEFIKFADYHFITAYTSSENHSLAWSILSMCKALGYVIGPLLAGTIIVCGVRNTFVSSIAFYVIAVVGLYFFVKTHKQTEHVSVEIMPEKRSFFHELKIWRTLGAKVWPILLFSCTIFLVDATFWSIGTLLSEQLKTAGAPGEYFLTLYMIPSLFVGLAAPFVEKRLGKKRGAFAAGLLSALFMIPIGFVSNAWILLGFVFVSAIFGSVSFPLINATYTDYMARLGEKGNDLIGLHGASASISYILGPILSGILADLVGIRLTFSIIGGFFFVATLLVMWVTPRKIHMPQKELSQV